MTPQNTYYAPNNKSGACVECMRDRNRKYRARLKGDSQFGGFAPEEERLRRELAPQNEAFLDRLAQYAMNNDDGSARVIRSAMGLEWYHGRR